MKLAGSLSGNPCGVKHRVQVFCPANLVPAAGCARCLRVCGRWWRMENLLARPEASIGMSHRHAARVGAWRILERRSHAHAEYAQRTGAFAARDGSATASESPRIACAATASSRALDRYEQSCRSAPCTAGEVALLLRSEVVIGSGFLHPPRDRMDAHAQQGQRHRAPQCRNPSGHMETRHEVRRQQDHQRVDHQQEQA